MHYLTYDESGAITGAYIQELLPEHEVRHLEVTPEQHGRWHDFIVVDGALTPRPGPDAATVLADKKEKLREDINRLRGEREAAGFEFNGVRFDSDDGSVRRITNAAVAAQAALATGQPYAVDWTTEDNSVMPLDAPGVIALQATMAAVGAAIHYRARDLKAAVAAATTLQALEAIDINAGWPT